MSQLLTSLKDRFKIFFEKIVSRVVHLRQCQNCYNWMEGALEETQWIEIYGENVMDGLSNSSSFKKLRSVENSFCSFC